MQKKVSNIGSENFSSYCNRKHSNDFHCCCMIRKMWVAENLECCLGSSIFSHHLHAQCYGLMSKEEETIWELESSLLQELSETRYIYCLAKLNRTKQLSVEEHCKDNHKCQAIQLLEKNIQAQVMDVFF